MAILFALVENPSRVGMPKTIVHSQFVVKKDWFLKTPLLFQLLPTLTLTARGSTLVVRI